MNCRAPALPASDRTSSLPTCSIIRCSFSLQGVAEVAVSVPRRRLAWARRRGPLLFLLLAAAGLAELGVYYWPQRLLFTARAALARRDYDAARAPLLHLLE